MTTYRVRVEQPLDIGPSDGVAQVISGLGGSVVSVDLHEVERAVAVDEMMVELPSDVDSERLRVVLEGLSDTVVLSSKACEPDAPLEQARRWANDTDHDPNRCRSDPEALSAACPLAAVSLCNRRDAESFPALQMTLERGTPVIHLAATFPRPYSSHELRSPRWLLAVPDDYTNVRTVALLTRPTAWRFTAPEVARVQLLMAS
jgi:hypothetical protein